MDEALLQDLNYQKSAQRMEKCDTHDADAAAALPEPAAVDPEPAVVDPAVVAGGAPLAAGGVAPPAVEEPFIQLHK